MTAVGRPGGRRLATDFRSLPATAGAYLTPLRQVTGSTTWLARIYGEPLQYWRICDANPDFLPPWRCWARSRSSATRSR